MSDSNGHDVLERDSHADATDANEEAEASIHEGVEAAEHASSGGANAVMEERDRLKDQLLRTAADFDNFRKRARRDVDEAYRRGAEEMLRELLPVIDNLERAADAAGKATDVNAVADGVLMVLRQFQDTAERLGLERLPAVGEKFDPSIHDAVQQQESADEAPGTITAEVAAGYRFRDKLLRPAMVVVAKPPAGKPAS